MVARIFVSYYAHHPGGVKSPVLLAAQITVGCRILFRRIAQVCNCVKRRKAVYKTHEAIISIETFNAVQVEVARRAAKHTHPGRSQKIYPFNEGEVPQFYVEHSPPAIICPEEWNIVS